MGIEKRASVSASLPLVAGKIKMGVAAPCGICWKPPAAALDLRLVCGGGGDALSTRIDYGDEGDVGYVGVDTLMVVDSAGSQVVSGYAMMAMSLEIIFME